ncbi:hypothetical protein BP5796_10312 [Coleophoma crateriformis]|uniref:Uncharacterized protein n=1 Tax=Coleophoma crateriformis TaxID=565419 RepID=A0A3D8QVC7_9HELO|nr:hypothetical protein BP5796_10312 [Coleophoma crateriformis]
MQQKEMIQTRKEGIFTTITTTTITTTTTTTTTTKKRHPHYCNAVARLISNPAASTLAPATAPPIPQYSEKQLTIQVTKARALDPVPRPLRGWPSSRDATAAAQDAARPNSCPAQGQRAVLRPSARRSERAQAYSMVSPRGGVFSNKVVLLFVKTGGTPVPVLQQTETWPSCLLYRQGEKGADGPELSHSTLAMLPTGQPACKLRNDINQCMACAAHAHCKTLISRGNACKISGRRVNEIIQGYEQFSMDVVNK